jgi:hypothetical protein
VHTPTAYYVPNNRLLIAGNLPRHGGPYCLIVKSAVLKFKVLMCYLALTSKEKKPGRIRDRASY